MVRNAEKPGLASCSQGGDVLDKGGRMGVNRNLSTNLGSGARVLGVRSLCCVTLGKRLDLSEPHFPHL